MKRLRISDCEFQNGYDFLGDLESRIGLGKHQTVPGQLEHMDA